MLLAGGAAVSCTDFKAGSLFFEDFSSGWESRWTYSSDPKYQGRFEAVTPPGWSEPGLQVRHPADLDVQFQTGRISEERGPRRAHAT